eukprot:g9067.t1
MEWNETQSGAGQEEREPLKDAPIGRPSNEIFRHVPPGVLPASSSRPPVPDELHHSRPKRPRPYRPDYEYYGSSGPQPYHRPIPGASMMTSGREYWPMPPRPPPYGMDPSMMSIPPGHYNPYAMNPSPGFDYSCDVYGIAAYAAADYDTYPMMQWRGRKRGGFAGARGRGERQMPGSQTGGKSRANSNDYNQHFVDTGQRPQNFLRDSQLEDQYEDYPNAKRLIGLKNELIAAHATPPYYLQADLHVLDLSLSTFGTKFDVALIDPPWEEYVRRAPGVGDGVSWTWQEIRDLRLEEIMDSPSFVFLWCGSEEGLEAGRHCLNKWGYRRCEDIVWIKTNKNPNQKYLSAANQEARSVLQHTKEHCLMGIKGTVRRALDGHVIHANIDTDVIISEEPPLGSTEKPDQLYQIIERFCLGQRRIELFGEDHNIRPGWVTIGQKLQSTNFKPAVFASHFMMMDGGPFIMNPGRPQPGQPNLLPSSEEIEYLRPKSPSQQ